MGQRQTSAGYLFSYFTNSISREYLISRSYIICINSIDYEKMKKIKQKEGPERANQQAMKIINSARNKSVEHRSALRAEEKIDHYLIQSRENDKRLYIILGQIRVSFSGKSETNNLIKKIQEAEKIFPEFERDVLNSFQFFRRQMEKKAERMKSKTELDQFFYEIIPQIMFLDNMKKKELHNIIDDFESKIDNLLTYLEPEVTQSWWHFW